MSHVHFLSSEIIYNIIQFQFIFFSKVFNQQQDKVVFFPTVFLRKLAPILFQIHETVTIDLVQNIKNHM